MFEIEYTNSFLKDMKRCKKRGYNVNELEIVLLALQKDGELPLKYKPHKLSGNLNGLWECHIKNDWLLIWNLDSKNKIITLLNTGTHSDLFK